MSLRSVTWVAISTPEQAKDEKGLTSSGQGERAKSEMRALLGQRTGRKEER